MTHKCFICMGSNMGDRRNALSRAVAMLESLPEVSVIRSSSLYETEPWGFKAQPDFFNCVVECRTTMDLVPFHRALKTIELEMGRIDAPRFHPRIIDLDILFFGEQIVSASALTVPHPALQERRFVLVPMLELAPDFMHPVFRKTIVQLYAVCRDEGSVRKAGEALTPVLSA